eukprot:2115949-Prorocentrum_lima.AAC.1
MGHRRGGEVHSVSRMGIHVSLKQDSSKLTIQPCRPAGISGDNNKGRPAIGIQNMPGQAKTGGGPSRSLPT